MALTLTEIYSSTKNKYKLSLIEGYKGLSRVMNWVYISEDISNTEFLRGGELIITTGVSAKDSKDWLYNFIYSMIKCGTCGIILNIGKYIKFEDISQSIKDLCSQHNYPLFIMPWKIHIYDITHDYYDRIFKDSQTDHSITDAFLHYIQMDNSRHEGNNLLESYNFSFNGTYAICVLKCMDTDVSDVIKNQIFFQMESYIKMNHILYHIAQYKNNYIFICHNENLEDINKAMNNILKELTHFHVKMNFRIGIGSLVNSLDELRTSYKRASAALTFALYKNTPLYNFEEMGFFKLLLSVEDEKLLKKYVDDYLGKVIEYDTTHNSNYLETLHNYLIHNGSIQLIAKDLFCHRNTINYRIRNLKENLNYNLDDINIRFNLMTAFLIKEYLFLFK